MEFMVGMLKKNVLNKVIFRARRGTLPPPNGTGSPHLQSFFRPYLGGSLWRGQVRAHVRCVGLCAGPAPGFMRAHHELMGFYVARMSGLVLRGCDAGLDAGPRNGCCV